MEIGKGPFDVRHQGSLGGVVNLVTRDPERGLHASPALSVGSFGYLNPSATASWAGEAASALPASRGGARGPTETAREGASPRRPTTVPEAPDERAYRVGTTWARVRYAVSADSVLTRVDHWMDDAPRTSAGSASLGWSMGTLARART